jgi:hypothetical protein
VGLISPFGPREARPKWRKFVPRASRAERIFILIEFTLLNTGDARSALSLEFFRQCLAQRGALPEELEFRLNLQSQAGSQDSGMNLV